MITKKRKEEGRIEKEGCRKGGEGAWSEEYVESALLKAVVPRHRLATCLLWWSRDANKSCQ